MSTPREQREGVCNFTVIGGGELLTKYLLPIASQRQDFCVKRIISRTEYKDFINHLYSNQDYPRYRKLDLEKIPFQHTHGTPSDIVKKINEVIIPVEIILIATSPHTHFKILKVILGQTDKKIYLEKPAVTNFTDFKLLMQLLDKYKGRVYLAEQYVVSRSVTFLEAFKKHKRRLGQIKSAELYIEEGQRYCNDPLLSRGFQVRTGSLLKWFSRHCLGVILFRL